MLLTPVIALAGCGLPSEPIGQRMSVDDYASWCGEAEWLPDHLEEYRRVQPPAELEDFHESRLEALENLEQLHGKMDRAYELQYGVFLHDRADLKALNPEARRKLEDSRCLSPSMTLDALNDFEIEYLQMTRSQDAISVALFGLPGITGLGSSMGPGHGDSPDVIGVSVEVDSAYTHRKELQVEELQALAETALAEVGLGHRFRVKGEVSGAP